MDKLKKKRIIKRSVIGILGAGVIGAGVILGVNLCVKQSVKSDIVTIDEAKNTEKADCILVLGAKVKADKSPSKILKDRLDKAIELYNAGVAQKLIMSGDHGTTEYDEVNEMKKYAIEAGIPSENIFMDHAGFSTYESMYRARDVFKVSRMVIVTQKYHMYRALYDAQKLGVEAIGVSAKEERYGGQTYRDIREIAARDKDFVKTKLDVKPTYLGDAIPISGNGDETNDKATKDYR